jgi:hypothetical protein
MSNSLEFISTLLWLNWANKLKPVNKEIVKNKSNRFRMTIIFDIANLPTNTKDRSWQVLKL